MRKYLIAYKLKTRDGQVGDGQGFAFADVGNGLPTQETIQEWERRIRQEEGFAKVSICSFQEVGQ